MANGRRVVILGVGLHPFGRFPDKPITEMARDASLAALKDAGCRFKDIEAGFLAWVQKPAGGAGMRIFGELGENGIPITNIEVACASGSRGAMLAADSIALGHYDMVMVIGAEKMRKGMLGGITGNEGESAGRTLDMSALVPLPGAYALMARRHMALYGTKPEHFAQVSVKAHKNGALNRNAQYQTPMTLEEVMESRMIADPLTLYQCCPTSDGASAVILASEEKARQFTSKPVYLVAWEGASPRYTPGEIEFSEGPTEWLAQKAYASAGLGPEDVNVAQVHDAFTPGEIFYAEKLGFCKEGEGGPFVWEGNTEITGKKPINTDGGLLSRGHPMGATGGAMITEITQQLRAQAGARQVANAKVGVLQNAGIGGINVMVLQK